MNHGASLSPPWRSSDGQTLDASCLAKTFPGLRPISEPLVNTAPNPGFVEFFQKPPARTLHVAQILGSWRQPGGMMPRCRSRQKAKRTSKPLASHLTTTAGSERRPGLNALSYATRRGPVMASSATQGKKRGAGSVWDICT